MKRLEGKVAIITGANAGIGKATAALFAREGANLVLAARRLDKLKEVEEYAASLGVKAISVSTDVSVAADCRRLVDTCVETFGRVDILVNNAGIDDKNMSITNCDEELWNKVIAVDQTSVYYMMREALRYMAPAGSGSIVLQRRCVLHRRQDGGHRHDQERGHPVRRQGHPGQRRLPRPHPDRHL